MCIRDSYNHHNKAKESSDGNVISGGSSQARGVYSGHPAHRTEEVNEIIPVDYLNKGHYGMYGPKEPSGHSNGDYLTLLNKYNDPTFSRGKYSDTHLPNNEHTTQYRSPESNPYVNPVKELSANSPGNKCDVKYYRSTSTAVPYENVQREMHNHSYRNANHVSSKMVFTIIMITCLHKTNARMPILIACIM